TLRKKAWATVDALLLTLNQDVWMFKYSTKFLGDEFSLSTLILVQIRIHVLKLLMSVFVYKCNPSNNLMSTTSIWKSQFTRAEDTSQLF
nr:hypothetical protein [Tanacetum cinerariifolium]